MVICLSNHPFNPSYAVVGGWLLGCVCGMWYVEGHWCGVVWCGVV